MVTTRRRRENAACSSLEARLPFETVPPLELGQCLGESAARAYSSSCTIDVSGCEVTLTPIPENFTCPIQQGDEPIQDPYHAVDGYVYEKSEIKTWFETRKKQGRPLTSPSTNLVVQSDELFPSIALRRAIEVYMAKRPEIQATFNKAWKQEAALRSAQEEMQRLTNENAKLSQALRQSTKTELSRALKQSTQLCEKLRAELQEAQRHMERVIAAPGMCRNCTDCHLTYCILGLVVILFLSAVFSVLLCGLPSQAPCTLAVPFTHGLATSNEAMSSPAGMNSTQQSRIMNIVKVNYTTQAGLGYDGTASSTSRSKAQPKVTSLIKNNGTSQAGIRREGTATSVLKSKEQSRMMTVIQRLYTDGPADVKRAVRSMLSLVKSSHDHKVLTDAAIVSQLIALQASQEKLVDVRHVALLVLRSAAIDYRSWRPILDAGAIAQLRDLLADEKAHVRAQAAVAIQDLAAGRHYRALHGETKLDTEFKTAIVESGVVGPLVELLWDNSKDLRLASVAALHELSFDHLGGIMAIGESGAINVLVENFVDTSEGRRGTQGPLKAQIQAWLQLLISEIFWNLAHGNESNQVAIRRAGAIGPLIEAMKARNITTEQDSRIFLDLRKTIAETLGALASGNSKNKALIVRLRAIPPLVELLRETHTIRGLRHYARAAATSLCILSYGSSENVAEIVRGGAIEPLAERLLDNDSHLRAVAAKTLGNLAFQNATNRALIVQAKVMPKLIWLLKDGHLDLSEEETALTRRAALGALRNLVTEEAFRGFLSSTDAQEWPPELQADAAPTLPSPLHSPQSLPQVYQTQYSHVVDFW